MRRSDRTCLSIQRLVGAVIPILAYAVLLLWPTARGAEPVKKPAGQAPPGMARVDSNVFALANTDSDTKMPQLFCGSMGRELFRQSLLIAAREELGLSTLDASIGEIAFVTDAPDAFPYRLEANFRPINDDPSQFSVEMKLSVPGSDGTKREWIATPLRIARKDPLTALAERCERLSREDFVQALKQLGFAPQKNDDAKAIASNSVEEHFEFVSQFSALRSLNAQRRAKGETVENLGDLIRGYANLGHLIDFLWSAGSKAYKARSLIYAQRLISKFGVTPHALAHRAYARALAGNHVAALEDIDAAKTAQGLAAPEWTQLIAAYCEYQPKILEQANEPHEELGRYLRMRLVDPRFDRDSGLHAIEEFIRFTPASFRAIEMICDMHSVGLARQITEGGADNTWPAIYGLLAKMADLPAGALEIADRQKRTEPNRDVEQEYRARVEFSQQLRGASNKTVERTEPSWRALAEIIDNESFVQTWRVVETETYLLGIPADDSIDRLYPLVEKHRLGPCIKCYSSDRETVAAAMKELIEKGDASSAEMPCITFAVWSYRLNPELYNRVVTEIIRHRDNLYDDLVRAGSSNVSDLYKDVSTRLSEVAPNQPRSIVRRIQYYKKFSKTDAVEFERKYGQNAQVMLALGRKHIRWNQSDAATRCLQKSIELAPTHDAYFLLADEYRMGDDRKQALEILERALKLPSYGLEESNVHVKIADLLMQQGEWKAAAPHAHTAAEAYSARGLLCAARCAEGQKQWAVAEKYYRAVSERYSGSEDDWYHFCVRRGRGNTNAAHAFARQSSQNRKPPLNAGQIWSVVTDQLLADNPKQALEVLTHPENKAINAATNSHVLLLTSLLADQLGDDKLRDSCYANMESRLDRTQPFPTLINFFRKALQLSSDPKWDHRSFDELIAATRENEVDFVYFCAGVFLSNHGDVKLGREYLGLAATSPEIGSRWCVIANQILRKNKVKIGDTRLSSKPDAWQKNAKATRQARRAVYAGRFDDAKAFYSEAVELRPDDVVALKSRADFYFTRGNDEAAIADYRAALKLNPNSEGAAQSLAALLAKSNQESLRNGEEALKYAQQAFDNRVTKYWTQYMTLAAAEAECGHFDKAVELQKKAIELAPKDKMLPQILASFEEGKPFYFKKRPENTDAVEEEPETEE